MNLTLSVDEKVINQARKVARSMGKSLNQLIREHLNQIATGGGTAQQDIDELNRLSLQGDGHSNGWRFNRDELHERS